MSLEEPGYALCKSFKLLLRRPENQGDAPAPGDPETILHHLQPEELLQHPVLIGLPVERLEPVVGKVRPEHGTYAGEAHLCPPRNLGYAVLEVTAHGVELVGRLGRVDLSQPCVSDEHGEAVVVEGVVVGERRLI